MTLVPPGRGDGICDGGFVDKPPAERRVRHVAFTVVADSPANNALDDIMRRVHSMEIEKPELLLVTEDGQRFLSRLWSFQTDEFLRRMRKKDRRRVRMARKRRRGWA